MPEIIDLVVNKYALKPNRCNYFPRKKPSLVLVKITENTKIESSVKINTIILEMVIGMLEKAKIVRNTEITI